MAPPLLSLRDIFMTFGKYPLLDGVNISIAEGDRICLVGRNGSGKSTLLKIASGIYEAGSGERFINPGVTFRYLPQEPELSGYVSSLKYVEGGLSPGDDAYKALSILEQLGLRGNENPNHLSVGEARRCAIARVLAPEPDILFLDEPTNHLDLSMIEWLENQLISSKSALVLVSHDRRFLETLTHTTLWIDRGRIRRLDHGFSAFESWRDKILNLEEAKNQKLNQKIHRENHWLIHGVTARRKRNQGRLQLLQDMKRERRQKRIAVGKVRMVASDVDLSGRLVVEAEAIFKSFGNSIIVKDFSTRIMRGDRVGMVGPNGAGKTTLLNLLTGKLDPDAGSVRVGKAVQMISLDQRRESLNTSETLSRFLTDGQGDMVFVNGQRKHFIGYMKDFLFTPEQADTPIQTLSGGERSRLILARALAQRSNFLVLDEPTNDLDLETLDVLQELLSEYRGTVLIVSHDRDFLDRVSTSVIVSEGDGRWLEYEGGYMDMLAQRKSRIEPATTSVENPKKGNFKFSVGSKNPRSKSKLSYNEVYALEVLPDKIKELEAEIDRLRLAFEDPNLYEVQPKKFQLTAEELLKAEAKLSAMEEEWMAIEIRREELDKP